MTKGIYKLSTSLSSKVYVGSSINIENRINAHKKILSQRQHSSKTLQAEVTQAGIKDLQIEIVEIVDNESLLDRERYWVEFYDSLDNGHNRKRIPQTRA